MGGEFQLGAVLVVLGLGSKRSSCSISNLSLREVHFRKSNFLVGVVGRACTNHHTHSGPLGQHSGTGSMSGRAVDITCIIINYAQGTEDLITIQGEAS